jgi:mannose-1-phosphate guanylyltransferase
MFMILCGGKGQRLWPISRQGLPKQFVSLNNQKTLLEATANRLKPLMSADDQLGLVTSREYFQPIHQLLGDSVGTYVIEPTGKNTAPAILLACLQIADEQTGDPVIVFTPSDHYIKEQDIFEETLKKTIEYAENYGDICLVGVKPQGISTSYGYIMAHEKHVPNIPTHIDRFIEKPPHEVAAILTSSPYALWNCGIFVARASVFLKAFKEASPTLFEQVSAFRAGKLEYSQLKACPFDTTVTEKISNRVAFPTTITWRDLGDLESFVHYTHQAGPDINLNNISLHGDNNIALSKKKMVAFLGVSNLCVIETDDIILIKQRGDSDSIKDLIGTLENQGMESLL